MEEQQEVRTDALERAQELIRWVREHLRAQEYGPALDVFQELHPADQADLLAQVDREQQQELLRPLTPEQAAEILEQMEPQQAARVFSEVAQPELSDILDMASPDVAADLLKQLPEEQSQEALEGMEEGRDVTPLLQYPDDSAGGIMTTEYVSVREDMTAAIALDSVRILGPSVEDVGSVVIVDEEGKLEGSLSLVHLALARPTTLIREIMNQEVVSVAAETDQEECARLMERYDLKNLPVVDENRRLLGVILVDDLVDVLADEATEDMYRMGRIGRERLFGPLQTSIRRRLPWLFLNLGTAILAALVISLFESTIAKVVALAVFLPVIAGQGGIGGTQTLTLMIRSIAVGDLPEKQASRLLVRELLLGIIHGVLLGLAVGLLAFVWKGPFMLGVVVGVAMLGNMVVAGLAGGAVPLALRVLRLDPALGSAVIVTTITDVVGFFLFLGIAALLVNSLV